METALRPNPAALDVPETMSAAVIDAFGPPGVFRTATLPVPTPGPGQVLVRVEGTSVNPVDYKIRGGSLPPLAPPFPAVLHMDVAGTVVARGEGATAFAVGDAVFGCAGGTVGAEGPLPGALAEYMACDERLLAPKPDALSFREAGALPLVSLTASEALNWTKASVSDGDRVLVYGGTGGVGHVAVQLAAALGAEVTATGETEAKRAAALALGARHAADYREAPPEVLAERFTDGAGFDVVFDTVGGGHIETALRAARPNGHVVTTTSSLPVDLTRAHERGLSVHVVFMLLPLLTGADRERHGRTLRDVARLVEDGQLRPLLDEARFGLLDAAAAYARAESGEAVGKVTLARD